MARIFSHISQLKRLKFWLIQSGTRFSVIQFRPLVFHYGYFLKPRWNARRIERTQVYSFCRHANSFDSEWKHLCWPAIILNKIYFVRKLTTYVFHVLLPCASQSMYVLRHYVTAEWQRARKPTCTVKTRFLPTCARLRVAFHSVCRTHIYISNLRPTEISFC